MDYSISFIIFLIIIIFSFNNQFLGSLTWRSTTIRHAEHSMGTLVPVYPTQSASHSGEPSQECAEKDLDCAALVIIIFSFYFDREKNLNLCYTIDNKTCSGVIYGNNTYFVNQNYPQSYSQSGQCYVTVNRLTPNICQMR